MEITCAWRPPRNLAARPDRRRIKQLIRRAAALAGLPADSDYTFSVRFIADRAMAAANEAFVGHAGPTDVITFSYLDDPDSLFPGDVAVELLVGIEAARRESETRAGATFASELVLYVVHGFLHAAGEDDLTPAPRKRMRRREREVMRVLRTEFDLESLFAAEAAGAK